MQVHAPPARQLAQDVAAFKRHQPRFYCAGRLRQHGPASMCLLLRHAGLSKLLAAFPCLEVVPIECAPYVEQNL
jgi:hypothetical protein